MFLFCVKLQYIAEYEYICSALQVVVEVLGVNRVEEEVPVAYSGDNVKLKLKGIEEEVHVGGVCVCVYCVCLLYTSPSPRDATLSRMPSSA